MGAAQGLVDCVISPWPKRWVISSLISSLSFGDSRLCLIPTSWAPGYSLMWRLPKPFSDGRRSPGFQYISENFLGSLSTSSCFSLSSRPSLVYTATRLVGLVSMCWPGKVIWKSGSNWAITVPFVRVFPRKHNLGKTSTKNTGLGKIAIKGASVKFKKKFFT